MLPFGALLTASLIWGANSPVMKWALENVPVFSLAFIRFGTASLILFPFLYKNLKIDRADFPKVLLAAFFAVNPHIPFLFFGLKLTFAINAGLIVATVPILTILAASLYLREKITLTLIASALVAIVGLIFVIGPPIVNFGVTHLTGSLLILGAALTWVGFEIVSKKLFKKYPPEIITFHAMWIGALTLLPFVAFEFFQNPTWVENINERGLIGIGYGIFFSSLVAYLAWQWGLSKLTASEAGFFLYLEPVTGILVAMILLGEKVTNLFVIGAILVIYAVYLAEHKRKFHPLYKKRQT